jgi:hypothetical protein
MRNTHGDTSPELRLSRACPFRSLHLSYHILLITCFPDRQSRYPNGLYLISFRFARMCGDDTFWMAEHHFQPEGPKARNSSRTS